MNSEELQAFLAEMDAQTNPRAVELADQYADHLNKLDGYTYRIGEIIPPDGNVLTLADGDGDDSFHEDRAATDEECKIATLELFDDKVTFDVTGDIPQQVADGLRKVARRLIRVAKRLEIAASAETFPPPVE